MLTFVDFSQYYKRGGSTWFFMQMEPQLTRPRNGQRFRRICFTVNNYTPAEYTAITVELANRCTWLVVGKEVAPDTGTQHLQGACIFKSPVALSTIKKIPGLTRAHIEDMRGTPAHSLIYCSKEGEPFQSGTMPAQGKRTDIDAAVERIQQGATMRELAQELGSVVVKYSRGLSTVKSLLTPRRDPSNPPTVYWLYGSTGTGKTRCAWEFGQSLYPDSVWISSSASLQWFSSYDGQRVAIFDDFRAKGVSFAYFLKLLDRYPLDAPIKGSDVNWAPDIIIVTTPHDICTTFSKRAEHIPEDLEQLARRITTRFYFPDEKSTFLGLLNTTDDAGGGGVDGDDSGGSELDGS